jgi:Na+/H+-dicarboxylate symporter
MLLILRAYSAYLSFAQQLSMLAVLMLTTKSTAAVPGASLFVIATTLGRFSVLEPALLLNMGVGHFLDMERTATNVAASRKVVAFL